MLEYAELMKLTHTGKHEWTERDTMLYALGAGMGRDPLDDGELDFVYEGRGQKVLPTYPLVFTTSESPLARAGLDYANLLHGEAAVTLTRPVPPSGKVTTNGWVVDVWDKGADKGVVVKSQKSFTLEGETEPFCTIDNTVFSRTQGGRGGSSEPQPKPHPVPDRAPDETLEIPTTEGQALLYRLSGDANPLHADPAVARKAGFPRPILHGLCTLANCGRAVVKAWCDNDPSAVRHLGLRFSAVVFPGDLLTVDMWRDGQEVSFEARVVERGVKVISNGIVRLA